MVNLCCGIKYVREVLPKRFAGVRRVELTELISKKRKQINLLTIKVLNAGHVDKNPFALKSRLLDARLPFLFFNSAQQTLWTLYIKLSSSGSA